MKWLLSLLLIGSLNVGIMARTLSAIIEPMSDLVAWYKTDQLVEGYPEGGTINGWPDASGNEYELFIDPFGDLPTVELNSLNGYPSVKFDGTNDPLLYSGSVGSVKHVFVVAKYDGGSTFAGYNGLLSAETTNALLIGDSGTTKFYNFSLTGFNFYKNQTAYTATNQQAPISQFDLIEMSNSGGVSMNGIQIGQDRADTGRKWNGRVLDPILFSAVKTAAERNRINLYYDLKYSLWKRNGVVQYQLNFPDQNMFPELLYARYRVVPLDWSSVTIKHVYEDEGASFSDTSDGPVQFWEIEYTGLTPEQADIFDAFNDAVRRKHTFNFTDKEGTTHTGVRIESYERDHDAHKSWNRSVSFRLAKYQ